MPLFIVQNDIIKMNVDCIVVSADVSLRPMGGISTAVYDAVDESEQLLKECEKIGFCGGCECVTTNSYGLPSKYIIHSVAPIFADSKGRAKEYIKECYKNVVYMARRKMFENIAVPLIGTGKKGFPKDMVISIAIEVFKEFLSKYDMNIYFVIHNKASFFPTFSMFGELDKYISEHFVDNTPQIFNCLGESFVIENNEYSEVTFEFSATKAEEKKGNKSSSENKVAESEKDFDLSERNKNFSELLNKKLKEHRANRKVYKKANIEKFAFERLKNNSIFKLKKETVLAIAIALEMDLSETKEFMEKSGYDFSDKNKQNVIVKYFIENNIYDIYTVNQMLFYYEEEQLGAVI